MKTAEEKAIDIVHHVLFGGLSVAAKTDIARLLVKALKEQDRDTRHACAEAMIKLSRTVSQCSTVEFCKGFNAATCAAHDTCMNVKAV